MLPPLPVPLPALGFAARIAVEEEAAADAVCVTVTVLTAAPVCVTSCDQYRRFYMEKRKRRTAQVSAATEDADWPLLWALTPRETERKAMRRALGYMVLKS